MSEPLSVREAPASYQIMRDTLCVRAGYKCPKGYKQTEVGVIPEDWDAKNMEQITIHIGDGLHGTPIYSPNGDYSFINGNNLDGGKIVVTTDTKSVDCSEFVKYRKPLNNRSILLSINGTIGNLALYDDEQIVLGKSAAYLNIRPEVCKNFVYHSLQTNIVRRQFFDGLTGSTIGNLGLATIRKTQIPLPPTNTEQRAIATALSDVDALLAAQDKLIAKKRDIKQAAMQQLLTGKQRLPGFSGEWEVKTLFDLAERKKELFDDGDWIESEHITTEGIRLIQTGNIGVGCFVEKEAKKFIYENSFTSLRCKQLRMGDLLVCRLADPAGRACVLPDIGEERIVTSVDVTIFRPPQELADRTFLMNVFSTPDWFRAVSDRSGGTTHKRISRGALGRIAIKLPSIEEQAAIATVLSDMDADLTALEQQRDKTRALKQGMMQVLLTGKIRLVESGELKVESGR